MSSPDLTPQYFYRRLAESAQAGMSLVELLISVGVLSIITFGSAAVMQSTMSKFVQTENRKGALHEVSRAQIRFMKAVELSGSCTDFLAFTGRFQPSGRTPVQIRIDDQDIRSDSTLRSLSGQSLQIENVYLDETELALNSSTFRVYATTLFLKVRPKPDEVAMQAIPVSNLSVRVNNSGDLMDCTFPNYQNNQELCESIQGLTWNEAAGVCEQAFRRYTDNPLFVCPEDMLLKDGICYPTRSVCNYNRVPQDFERGIVADCASLPAGYAILYPPGSQPPNAPTVAQDQNSPTQPSPTPTPTRTPYPSPDYPGGGVGGGGGGSQTPAPSPTPTPPQYCDCNGAQVPATVADTTLFCATARGVGNRIGGGVDFEGDVEVSVFNCTEGSLEFRLMYYDEESDNVWPGRKQVQCNTSGRDCRVRRY